MLKKKKLNFKQWMEYGGKLGYRRGGDMASPISANTNATSEYVEPERWVDDSAAQGQRTAGSVISAIGGVATAINPLIGAALGAIGGIVSGTAQPTVRENRLKNTNPYGYKNGGKLGDPIKGFRGKRSEMPVQSLTTSDPNIQDRHKEHIAWEKTLKDEGRSVFPDIENYNTPISKEQLARKIQEEAAAKELYMQELLNASKKNKTGLANGGDLEALSDNSIQVKADNPAMTDSVETDTAMLDHNEVVTGTRVYSDSLVNPNTGNSFAKDEERNQKLLGKFQKRQSKLGDTEYKDEEYLNRNSKALFDTQENVAQVMGLRNPDGTPKQEGGMQFGGIKKDPPTKGNPIEEMILNKIMLLKNQDKPNVKRLLSSDPQVIDNSIGESMKASEARGAESISTHQMGTSWGNGGYDKVFPTISEDKEGKLSYNEDWRKAIKENDYMEVPANMSEKFSHTGYKQGAKGLNEDMGYKFRFGGMIGKSKPKYIGGGPIKDPTNLFGDEIITGGGGDYFGNNSLYNYMSPSTVPDKYPTNMLPEYTKLNGFNMPTWQGGNASDDIKYQLHLAGANVAFDPNQDYTESAPVSGPPNPNKFNQDGTGDSNKKEFPFGEVGTGVGLVSNIINKLTNKPTFVNYKDLGKAEIDLQDRAMQNIRQGESAGIGDLVMEGKVARENLSNRSLQSRNANLRNIATGISKAKAGIRADFASRLASAQMQSGQRRSAIEESNRQKDMNVDVINTQEADAVRTEGMKMDENVRKLLIEYQLGQNNKKTNEQLAKLLKTSNFKFDLNSPEGIEFIKMATKIQR